MTMNTEKVRKLLRQGAFRELFVDELGWNNHGGAAIKVVASSETFTLEGVAQKCGFVVYVCSPTTDGDVPSHAIRQQVERQALKAAFEHLIIFCDAQKKTQVWQWVRREAGQRPATREQRFRASEKETALLQKLESISFELAEEEQLDIVTVAQRVQRSLDVEKLTKQFYERFVDEHKAFLEFIKGIKKQGDRDWYASVMLNRMMFVYFIQKKGFLDNDRNYLRNRLTQLQRNSGGTGKFVRFYRYFILKLFHEGLGQPVAERASDLEKLVGKVPYLNGGLFEVHQLERENTGIEIPDGAFDRIFKFFDSYTWHVDDRPLRADNEINPDVLGYIFQKYINNQDEMGAYYTKEDVTGYMCSNSIVPLVMGRVARAAPGVFAPAGVAWSLLANSAARYVPEPLRFGTDEILAASASKTPDSLAGEAFTRCKETWQQHVRRRAKCAELEKRLKDGTVRSWDELVTLNVDLVRFAQDLILASDDGAFLRATWDELRGLAVLDPTCGSGAFLFAALNVLAPLYTACLEAMEVYCSEQPGGAESEAFAAILKQLSEHPNRPYFVMKSIIVGNLYGVDLMEEAVEICKLRLFLKLVAQVSIVDQIEPLPDIDFNVRPGNALVGFASLDELRGSVASVLNFAQDAVAKIEASATTADEAFQRFRQLQTEHGADRKAVAESKKTLREQLAALRDVVDRHLAGENGVDARNANKLQTWIQAHKPFHWFVEFYSIIKSGGFDVIVGNPPYVNVPEQTSRSLLKKSFASALDKWSRDEDVYTFVMERSLRLLDRESGGFAMIVPLSLAFSTKKPFVALRSELMKEKGTWWWSHYDRIPSGLFGGEVRTRCTIALLARTDQATTWAGFTSGMQRWESTERDLLLSRLAYAPLKIDISKGIPKVSTKVQSLALSLMLAKGASLKVDLKASLSFTKLKAGAPDFPQPCVYIGGTAYNWFPAWRDIPETTDEEGNASLPARTIGLRFSTEEEANVVFALLCSSMGYWWWVVASDAFNLKKWLVERFPVSTISITPSGKKEISAAAVVLRKALLKQYQFKDNKGRIGNFFLPGCVKEVAAIDALLAKHVPGLSPAFFEDIRAFNDSFSRAAVVGDGDGDGGDDDDD